jgi:hypothetical protein
VSKNSEKPKPCLIACSVLKEEILQLKRQGDLDADVVFVSKFFHVDYDMLKKNLRKTLQQKLSKSPADKPIVVYGDLCLGPNGEMKELAAEYGVVKVDALNCLDCVLGGKGKIEEADPNHEFMFFDPGMIDFFRDAKEKMKKEGMDENAFRDLFIGIKGIILLDTLGDSRKCEEEIEKLHTCLEVVETKKVGLDKLNQVISEAIQQSRQKTK